MGAVGSIPATKKEAAAAGSATAASDLVKEYTERAPHHFDSILLRFGLPEGAALDLSTCACLLLRLGEKVCPYTPVSTNAVLGGFELLVKVYNNRPGSLSTTLSTLALGATCDFKHIPFNVKVQYPFGHKAIGMLVGGSGVTPMLQALHAVLGTAGDDRAVSMLYASKARDAILARETLDDWVAKFPSRFLLEHVLSAEPADSPWEGRRGRIDRALVETRLPGPATDPIIFVCGPPAFYDAFCGPRTDPDLTGVLADLGYTKDQVVKF